MKAKSRMLIGSIVGSVVTASLVFFPAAGASAAIYKSGTKSCASGQWYGAWVTGWDSISATAGTNVNSKTSAGWASISVSSSGFARSGPWDVYAWQYSSHGATCTQAPV